MLAMAYGFSSLYLRKHGPFGSPINYLKFKLRPVRVFKRKLQMSFTSIPDPLIACSTPSVDESLFNAQQSTFQANDWCFVENFFSVDFASQLRATWPPRRFFEPMANTIKSYDFGFKWIPSRGVSDPKIKRFPILKRTFEYLRSTEFCQLITLLCGDSIHRRCFSTIASTATSGASLIPHKDSIALQGSALNIILFVNGNGLPPHAGGTCIIADNEFRNILFEPSNLINTALIYSSTADFYHGFKKLKRGNFRHAITAQFCPATFLP